MDDDTTGPGVPAELNDIAARLRAIEAALANQRSAFIDIAGARSAELRAGLDEVSQVVGELRREMEGVQELQKAVRGRLYDLVTETVQPELRAALGPGFPHMVVDALSPDLRQALHDWLPTFMVEAVRPEVRQSLDERLPAVVTEAVTPEVRRSLAERLPTLVSEAVRPEVRATISERLSSVVAQVVSPEVGNLLAERLPGMLAEILTPELAESLTEIEASAAELRGESARLRSLREVVTEQLPAATIAAVEPSLTRAIEERIPELLAAAVEPSLLAGLSGDLPRLLAQNMASDLSASLAQSVPAALTEGLRDELVKAAGETIAMALPGAIKAAVEPELRENLSGSLPMAVAETVVAALGTMVAEQLPGQLTDLVLPQMAVSLTEVERNAAELRHETAQLRNLREGIAERMPEAVVNSVQPIFEDLLAVRLPTIMGETVGPALQEVLSGRLAELVQAAVQDEVGYVLREIAGQHDEGPKWRQGVEANAETLERMSQELSQVRDHQARLHQALPDMIATAVSLALRSAPSVEAGLFDQDQTLAEAVRDTSEAPSPSPTPEQPEAPEEPEAPEAPEAPEEPKGPDDGDPGVADLDQGEPASDAEAPTAEPAPSDAETPPDPAPPVSRAITFPALPDPAEGDDLIRDLPGLVAGPSLAAGVAVELRRARLRRRRRRQAGPPVAALHRYDPHADVLIRDLERYALASQAKPGRGGEHLAVVALGQTEGVEALFDFGHRSLCLTGANSRDVARAAVLSLLTGGPDGTVEVIAVGGLLPGGPDFPGLSRAAEDRVAISRFRDELARRRRAFAADGDTDLLDHRRRHPDNPMPVVVLASADLAPERAAEVARLAHDAAGLGLSVLLADTSVEELPTVTLDHEGLVTGVDGDVGEQLVEGTRTYAAGREATGTLLGLIAAGRTERADEDVAPAVEDPFQGAATEDAPVQVDLLGTYRIRVDDREIRSGLRAKARELLAFYLLHPEGTTMEEATEALWPEADPRRGSEWFWTALGNLRSRLRQATGDSELKVIEREGDLYRIEALFDVDLWRYVDRLGEAAAISGEPAWAEALERAVEAYRGDLVSGADWSWVEVPRQELRDRQVDVLVSLAATRLVGGQVREALDALQQAVEVDPLAEQLYRRIMRLQSRLGRDDQVDSTFSALVARLAEVGLEPAADSVALHRELTST